MPTPTFSKSFWTMPAPAAIGSPSPDPLWMAIGKTTTIWEQVDVEIARLFGDITGVGVFDNPSFFSVGFVDASSVRRELAARAGEAWFGAPGMEDKTLRKELGDLRSHHQEASQIRNNIVHSVIEEFRDGPRVGFFAGPPMYASKKIQWKAKPIGRLYLYQSTDIDVFVGRLEDLRAWLSDWRNAFSKRYRG